MKGMHLQWKPQRADDGAAPPVRPYVDRRLQPLRYDSLGADVFNVVSGIQILSFVCKRMGYAELNAEQADEFGGVAQAFAKSFAIRFLVH